MIIFEFSFHHVISGNVPGEICQVPGTTVGKSGLEYFHAADRVYALNGTTAKMLKNRFAGQLEDIELTRENAVALVLKAIPLKS